MYGRSASDLDADLIYFTAHTGAVCLVQDSGVNLFVTSIIIRFDLEK
jgi:hypothetical protein